MLTHITAVALRTIPHNDRASVLTAWSPQCGRISFVLPASNSPESRRRRALTMPLSLFEGIADIKPGGALSHIRDLRRWSPDGRPVDVAASPVRASVAIFLSEVLGIVTREEDADAALWALIIDAVTMLSRGLPAHIAVLPLVFLLRVAEVLGIAPDCRDYTPGAFFDMQDGIFRRTAPLHKNYVDRQHTRALYLTLISHNKWRDVAMMMRSHSQRNAFIDNIIKYFALHGYPVDRVRSLDILKTVFS